jgi:hypothetical protein
MSRSATGIMSSNSIWKSARLGGKLPSLFRADHSALRGDLQNSSRSPSCLAGRRLRSRSYDCSVYRREVSHCLLYRQQRYGLELRSNWVRRSHFSCGCTVSAQIFLLGAEFTKAYRNHRPRRTSFLVVAVFPHGQFAEQKAPRQAAGLIRRTAVALISTVAHDRAWKPAFGPDCRLVRDCRFGWRSAPTP